MTCFGMDVIPGRLVPALALVGRMLPLGPAEDCMLWDMLEVSIPLVSVPVSPLPLLKSSSSLLVSVSVIGFK